MHPQIGGVQEEADFRSCGINAVHATLRDATANIPTARVEKYDRTLEGNMNFHRSASLLPALAMLALAACASGSAIVTGNPRNPVAPELVKLYLEPPAAFEVIGLVKEPVQNL
jgi:hypothetical protein